MTAVDPVDRLKAQLRGLPARLGAEAGLALHQIGDDIVAAIRAELAAKGEEGGGLAASLGVGLDASGRVVVTASHPAAAFLEYGTRTMAARPFLRPAVVAAEPAAREIARDALVRAVSGSGGEP